MAYISNILLGRITKISGYEGAVTVKLEKTFIENIPQLESVFLEIDGRPVPFFISGSEYSGADILKLRFVGYDSIEKVSEFSGCRVFLTSGIQDDIRKEDFISLIGYTVYIQAEAYTRFRDRVRPGGAVLIDNLVWSGRVAAGETDPATAGVREYIRRMWSDSRYLSSLMPTRDGVGLSLRLR